MRGDIVKASEIETLSQLIDYLAQASEGLAALVLVMTGAVAWAVKSYVATLVWYYRRRSQVNELASILRSDIKHSIEGYRRNFNEESKQNTIDILNGMQQGQQFRPFVTASSQDNPAYVRHYDMSILPPQMSEPYAAYRISEMEFDASYAALGNPRLPEAGYKGILATIEEVYRDSASCIAEGERAIAAFDAGVAKNNHTNARLYVVHVGLVVIIVIGLWRVATTWPN